MSTAVAISLAQGEPGLAKKPEPKILVFSTGGISDPGIDQAGSSHLSYSPGVVVVSVPCSSGIKPSWAVHALEAGFEGVFIAADGGDCAFLPDCTAKTARVVERAQALAKERGLDPQRVKMAAVCSVCSESFVAHMKQFGETMRKIRG
jgi:F420-non-reducing hydrogenase iron-sulfur subunit